MNIKEPKILLVVGILLLIVLIAPALPFTTSLFIAQATDLNYSQYANGDYNGKILYIDGNILTAIDANFSSGGDSNIVDTNTQTAGWTNSSGAYLIDLNLNKNKLRDVNVIMPRADSINALGFYKADGITPVATIDTTNKRLGVGTIAPMVAFHSSDGATVASGIKAFWNDASDMMISANQPTFGSGLRIAVAHDTTVNSRPLVAFVRTRGTLETPASVQLNDNLGDLLFGGASSDGSIAYGGGLFAYSDGATTVGGIPTRLSFVSGNHSGDRKERLTIKANGEIRIAQPNPVLYYLIDGSTTPARSAIYGASPGSIYHTMNAYFDGSNWQRDDATKAAVFFSLDAGSATVLSRFRYAAAGANPITPLTAWQVSPTGVFQVPKLSPIADSTTAMQFFKADGTTAVMTIDSTNSRLGIGTATPAHKLDVSGSGGANIDLRVNGRIQSNNNDGGMWISTDRFLGGRLEGGVGKQIGWYNNGAWRVVVDENGRMGIGTTAPAYNLDVVQSANAIVGVKASNSNAGTSAQSRFFADNGTSSTSFGHTGTGYSTYGALTASSGYMYSSGAVALVLMADSVNGTLKFATGGSSERMRIDKDGKVGIGTTAPATKLDVNGTTNSTAYSVGGVAGIDLNMGLTNKSGLGCFAGFRKGILTDSNCGAW